ncbi:hypothetical protein [uncultured Jannaschia sp.]|nr:hypothetical protein [uncultured Jannaschia sp.]
MGFKEYDDAPHELPATNAEQPTQDMLAFLDGQDIGARLVIPWRMLVSVA